MKILRINLLTAVVLMFSVTLFSCKSKKIAAKPVAPVATPVEEKAPEPAPAPQKEEPAPAPEKPDFNFSNIQFEFNSVVLKTGSYQILEKASREMKKDLSAKFVLNGHSSAEGSIEHNMSLSVDRANAVKTYLVNSGIDAANLSIKGFGETKPLVPNTTEEGRAVNRRVEIKLAQ